MPLGYIILFIAGPLLELALLIKAGQWLGLWAVFGIIFGTGILGVLVLRLTGVSVLRSMLSGQMMNDPVPSMMDTSVKFVAGALLILPGIIGDCLGLLLLIPRVRQIVIPRIWRAARRRTSGARVFRHRRWTSRRGGPGSPAGDGPTAGDEPPRRPAPSSPGRGDGPVIDGEFERLGERPLDPKRPQPGS